MSATCTCSGEEAANRCDVVNQHYGRIRSGGDSEKCSVAVRVVCSKRVLVCLLRQSGQL
jgi:hypothetical protein